MKRRHFIFIVLVLAGVLLAFLLMGGISGCEQKIAEEARRQGVVSTTAALPQTITNSKDGSELILIPAGEFLMGSPSGEGDNDEHPQHRVSLSAYYIGKYEVTNKQFAKFVNETGYQAKISMGPVNFSFRGSYSGYAAHPVVFIAWKDAKAYCDWANLRLPTEAEWEKAARGTDGRKYPWGNKWDASRCKWCEGTQLSGMAVSSDGRGTLPVGSFPSGASPYGAMDMAGNAWEWCADWYAEKYYSQSPQSNPQGPASGDDRILRGGSWCSAKPVLFRCADRLRGRYVPDEWYYGYGFRVCRSADTR